MIVFLMIPVAQIGFIVVIKGITEEI